MASLALGLAGAAIGSFFGPLGTSVGWAIGAGVGRGGFKVQLRWCLESTFSPANGRCFFGITPNTNSWLNVEPDSLTNIIGVGANAGEANLSILHNDASGTATKTTIVSDDSPSVNFPALSTDNVYDLILESVANSQIVTWQLTNVETGAFATGTISTNLPSNTTYMTPILWVNNGSTASAHALGIYRMVATSRY